MSEISRGRWLRSRILRLPSSKRHIDIWISTSLANAQRMLAVMVDFGFSSADVTAEFFTGLGRVVGMGVPPVRREVLTGIDGVTFEECYPGRLTPLRDEVPVSLIALPDLLANKRASGRHKDLDDLEHLPRR